MSSSNRNRSTSTARIRMEEHLDDTPPPSYAEVLKEKSTSQYEQEEEHNAALSLAHPQRVYIDRVFTSSNRDEGGRRDSSSTRCTFSNTKIRYLM